LACISHINELDLFVSLPYQLTGVVPITEISEGISAMVEKVANQDEDEDMDEEVALPNLKELFHIGQWVRCKITSLQTGDKKAIELSLKPKLVNEDTEKVDITPGIVSSYIRRDM
jgi:rRNA biogenesis protein RRP5